MSAQGEQMRVSRAFVLPWVSWEASRRPSPAVPEPAAVGRGRNQPRRVSVSVTWRWATGSLARPSSAGPPDPRALTTVRYAHVVTPWADIGPPLAGLIC